MLSTSSPTQSLNTSTVNAAPRMSEPSPQTNTFIAPAPRMSEPSLQMNTFIPPGKTMTTN